MSSFADYCDSYPDLTMSRTDGVLQVTLSTDGGPLRWSERVHRTLPGALREIGNDPDNLVIILTGSGDNFLADFAVQERATTPAMWEKIAREARQLLFDLLDIPVPVIAAVNGPATVHAELALLSDVVLAADTATFADHAHFTAGLVPGDGVHVLWPLLLGLNAARHFLLTGRVITAREALALGLVAEVLPVDRLLDRAWELARSFASRSPLTLRYTRQALTMSVRRDLQLGLAPGLSLESLGALDARLRPDDSRVPPRIEPAHP